METTSPTKPKRKKAAELNPEYKFDFDMLRLYFAEDYEVAPNIKIHQPRIGEIIEFGEKRMYSSIAPFVSNPTTYRLFLWNMNIDWNFVSDFHVFALLVSMVSPEDSSLIFGDLDFSKLGIIQGELFNYADDALPLILGNQEHTVIIDEEIYYHMREYIRLMFDMHPKDEWAKGKSTKEAIIFEELEKKQMEKSNNTSTLLPLVSSMVNHSGFKYKSNELKEIGIFEFMDSVKRLQVYENTISLMRGMYSGFLDTSKMNLDKELNWQKDLYS